MALRSFKLPDIGEGTAEAELVAWHVAIGDLVAEDQPLCDVMTDKATVEVTAPFGGKVIERTGNPGEMIPVGSVLLVFEEEGETDAPAEAEPAGEPAAGAPPAPKEETAASPAAHKVLAAPALRKRAADLGIDLRDVAVSGPHGILRQSDLDAYLAYRQHRPSEPARVAAFQAAPWDQGAFEEVPVIGLRRRIAERMQDTKRRIPHFSYIEEVDMTQLERLRMQLNDGRRDDQPKLTVLPFLIQALVRVLPEFPQLNALYDDAAGVVRRYGQVHAGIATQTPQGLLVSVIRDAARWDSWGLASELARVSDLARSGRAATADLTGSTITITSLGAMGGLATTPVINSPEVAIVGVNKLVERPIVREGRIEVAKMMNLSSSFDHRVVDGWDAALFVQRVKALLENPALLFMPA